MDPPMEMILRSPEREPFEYDPLPNNDLYIRLVSVAPTLSHQDGLIQCFMSDTKLSGARYMCLSYRWGKPEPRKRILVNGKYAFIQENLFEFLDTARSRHPTTLWIDALCINQDDALEKNHQVARMGNIYSDARCVCVWLGRPPEQPIECNNILDFLRPSSNDPPERGKLMHAARNSLIQYLFYNEYWCRCWVVQEIVLARHVVVLLGSDTIVFSQLVTAASKIQSAGWRQSPFAQFVGLDTGNSHVIGKSLISLLADFSMTKSTLGHDRIFALVSICREKARFEIDYECSIGHLIYATLNSCKESLCVCSTSVVLSSLVQTEKWYGWRHNPIADFKHYLKMDVHGLRFSFEKERETFQLDEDKERASHSRIASMRQIKSVEVLDPQHACSVLTRLLDHLFAGAIVVRLHKDRCSERAYNTVEDCSLSDLQSTTDISIRSFTDRFDKSSNWIGVEDEQNYLLTNTFSIRGTSTGHLISVSTLVLYTFLTEPSLLQRTNYLEALTPVHEFVPLCKRGLAQIDDTIGSSAPFRLGRSWDIAGSLLRY